MRDTDDQRGGILQMNNMFAAFRTTDASEDQALKVAETIGRRDELLNTAGLPNQDALTGVILFTIATWLIVGVISHL